MQDESLSIESNLGRCKNKFGVNDDQLMDSAYILNLEKENIICESNQITAASNNDDSSEMVSFSDHELDISSNNNNVHEQDNSAYENKISLLIESYTGKELAESAATLKLNRLSDFLNEKEEKCDKRDLIICNEDNFDLDNAIKEKDTDQSHVNFRKAESLFSMSSVKEDSNPDDKSLVALMDADNFEEKSPEHDKFDSKVHKVKIESNYLIDSSSSLDLFNYNNDRQIVNEIASIQSPKKMINRSERLESPKFIEQVYRQGGIDKSNTEKMDSITELKKEKYDQLSAVAERSEVGCFLPEEINLNFEQEDNDINDIIKSDDNIFSRSTIDITTNIINGVDEIRDDFLSSVPSVDGQSDCSPADELNMSLQKENELKSSLKRPHLEDTTDIVSVNCSKKIKKGISFDKVSVFYFPRTQGFTCIPSQGGSTLGMSRIHTHCKTFSLKQHASEQRKSRRHIISQQYSEGWNETASNISDDSEDSDGSNTDTDYENYNFLQPIPTKDRRAMLRAAGVRKIDSSEKDECRQIRISREYCGCLCQTYCDPETCLCSQSGIKCQVDRLNFPCNCSRDTCINPNGRIEFNPLRVRTHYIHTLMRLELEKKQSEEMQNTSLVVTDGANILEQQHVATATLNTDLSSCLSTNNLMNFHYANNLQQYYQQQPSHLSQYAAAISSSCFSFNYNRQFFSAASSSSSSVNQQQQQQEQNSTSSVNFTSMSTPLPLEYHSQPNLYESSMQLLQFCAENSNSDNNINDGGVSDSNSAVRIEKSLNDEDDEKSSSSSSDCSINKNEIRTVADFSELFETTSCDLQTTPISLKTIQETSEDEIGLLERSIDDCKDNDEDETTSQSTENDASDLGEIIKQTMVENVI